MSIPPKGEQVVAVVVTAAPSSFCARCLGASAMLGGPFLPLYVSCATCDTATQGYACLCLFDPVVELTRLGAYAVDDDAYQIQLNACWLARNLPV
jgi:hypothetical protein